MANGVDAALLKSLADIGAPSIEYENIKTIPTGSLILDWGMGSGLPIGRVIEIYGNPSVGKTSVAYVLSAAVQRYDPQLHVLYIDLDNSFLPEWASGLGIDLDRFTLLQPTLGEAALRAIITVVRSPKNPFGLVVLDSLGALSVRVQQECDIEKDAQVAAVGTKMSLFWKQLMPILGNTKTTLLVISENRQRVGVVYGKQTTTAGGAIKNFRTSLRIELLTPQMIRNDEDDVIGHVVRYVVTKNKVAPPYRKGEFSIYAGVGTDTATELADLGKRFGIFLNAAGNPIRSNGIWHYKGRALNGEQGSKRECAIQCIRSDPELFAEIVKVVQSKIEGTENGTV